MRASVVAREVQNYPHSLQEMRGVYALCSCFPLDVIELISMHESALSIQRQLARHRVRHVHHVKWRELRGLLASHGAFIVDDLTRSSLVRKEWRTEPESWIYELRRNPSLSYIVQNEIRKGYWT